MAAALQAANDEGVYDLPPEDESSLVPDVLELRQLPVDCDASGGGVPVNYDDFVTLPHDRGDVVFRPAAANAAELRERDMRLTRPIAWEPKWRRRIFDEPQESQESVE